MSNHDNRTYRIFLVSISLTIILFMSGISLGTALATRNLIREEILTRARAHFESIVLMRRWVASYGGVYVRKGPGVESNPYLVNSDITSLDGTVYTKRNPALVTRELSEMAEKDAGLLSFHITSLNPLNAANQPDSFERGALMSFARNHTEQTVTEQVAGRSFFRYMAPLFVEESCLECHASQGYLQGDIRGGISLSFDIAQVEQRQKQNFFAIIASGFMATASLLTLVYFFATRMIRQLRKSRARIEELAVTDELTRVYNRRYAFERFGEELEKVRRKGAPLSCLVIDFDHFKRINDEHGHAAGDAVLRVVAGALRDALRPYDILARLGGEEFLVLLPGIGQEEVLPIAERLRELVAGTRVVYAPGKPSLYVTVSIGIATATGGDADVKALLSQADLALYAAKRAGRNRCFQGEDLLAGGAATGAADEKARTVS
jgi:diguanylate cyclase (GGDEF)-like protein